MPWADRGRLAMRVQTPERPRRTRPAHSVSVAPASHSASVKPSAAPNVSRFTPASAKVATAPRPAIAAAILRRPSAPIRSPRFQASSGPTPIKAAADGSKQLVWGANLDRRPLDGRLPSLKLLADGKPHARVLRDHLESAMLFDKATNTYLWIQRRADPLVLAQAGGANIALGEYSSMLDRGRTLQLRFSVALFLVSLLIVAVAIWVAIHYGLRVAFLVGLLCYVAAAAIYAFALARKAVQTREESVRPLAEAA